MKGSSLIVFFQDIGDVTTQKFLTDNIESIVSKKGVIYNDDAIELCNVRCKKLLLQTQRFLLRHKLTKEEIRVVHNNIRVYNTDMNLMNLCETKGVPVRALMNVAELKNIETDSSLVPIGQSKTYMCQKMGEKLSSKLKESSLSIFLTGYLMSEIQEYLPEGTRYVLILGNDEHKYQDEVGVAIKTEDRTIIDKHFSKGLEIIDVRNNQTSDVLDNLLK